MMESYGAHCVYVTDSGRMLMHDARDKSRALRDILKPETQVGIHCTTICRWASPTPSSAWRRAWDRVDASLAGMGAGAGNTPLEVLIAVLDRMGLNHGCDLKKLMELRQPGAPAAGPPVRVDARTLALVMRACTRASCAMPRLPRQVRHPDLRHPRGTGQAAHGRRPGGHDR